MSAGIFRQKNLIVFAVSLLLVLSFQQIDNAHHNTNRYSRPTLALQLKLQQERKPEPTRAPQIVKAPSPLLMSWRGPVEPYSAPPNTAQVIYKIPTNNPVVFLTIDDGITQAPDIAAWLMAHHLPISLFLDDDAIKSNYPYFGRLQRAGMTIQNHTMTHPRLIKLNLGQQKAEICGTADTFANIFGRRPTLFRPPYGLFNDVTRQAATECGMQAIVMWHATVDDGVMRFQNETKRLEPGDIVLMHFRPNTLQDIRAFIDQVHKDNLQVGRLEDWLK